LEEDMVTSCSAHRRAMPAPVRTPADALAALELATDAGHNPAIVLACLDRSRRPLTLFIIDDSAAGPEELVHALDVLLDVVGQAGPSPLTSLVVATSRPGASVVPAPGDAARWDQMAGQCALAGVALLDWFVLADGASRSVPGSAGRRAGW